MAVAAVAGGKVTEIYRQLTARLEQLECEMQRLELWSDEQPAPQALASRQPFCIDTLTFVQWLQHVFVPTLRSGIKQRQPLPEKCAIAPMAEVYFQQLQTQQKIDVVVLVEMLQGIDATLSAPRESQQPKG